MFDNHVLLVLQQNIQPVLIQKMANKNLKILIYLITISLISYVYSMSLRYQQLVKIGFIFILVLCLITNTQSAETQAHPAIQTNQGNNVPSVQPQPVPQKQLIQVQKPQQAQQQPTKQKVQDQRNKNNDELPDPNVEIQPDENRAEFQSPQVVHSGWEEQKGQDVSFQVDPLADSVMQKQQVKIQQQERKKQEKSLHPWVSQEMDQNIQLAQELNSHEVFAFSLQYTTQFKWNPTEFKSGPLKFVVEVFFYQGGDIIYADNPEEEDCIEVLAKSQKSHSYTSLGKVYLKKIFTINFFSDYQFIQLKNNHGKVALVQISLQATKFVPEKALDDDNFKISAEKIKSILEQLEQTQKRREKTYRQEWSISDRQQHHQSQMLILTGVELIIILGTAIVQIYCIKNLFDNRLIV